MEPKNICTFTNTYVIFLDVTCSDWISFFSILTILSLFIFYYVINPISYFGWFCLSPSIPPHPRLEAASGYRVFLIIFLLNLFIYLFIFGCVGSSLLCEGFSLVAATGGYLSLQCSGFSLRWLLLLQSMGSRCSVSVVVAHRPSCSAACGIFSDQGSNPCPLHWQVDS